MQKLKKDVNVDILIREALVNGRANFVVELEDKTQEQIGLEISKFLKGYYLLCFRFVKLFKNYTSDDRIQDHFSRILKTKNLIIDSEMKIFLTLTHKKHNCVREVVCVLLNVKYGLFSDWKITKVY
ncbi:MAG: hypothetical protein US50_C0017G0003 [Candidatus Nomurabacteria bacterium GW2011_GWB1_37_5]|uniref:Uncharacterized protein n=1 Tax=Candidatus Nomurabacteria bacterium GW2011_GWB1_37_5 TaxID=1618742 RepID=A0A0G0GZ98_9BACT|nr:MAG: hypothetical protein US50_C0017G0003 [Candidatus Nomurabacteria bacterium GW2011_GWB1_37_5]